MNRIPGFRSADKTRLVVSMAGKCIKEKVWVWGSGCRAEGRDNQQEGRMVVLGDCHFVGTFTDAHIPLD